MESDAESSSGSDTSETVPRYIVPARRPVPEPRVNRCRPEQPSSIPHASCEGESSNVTTGRTSLVSDFQRDTPSFRDSSHSRSIPHSISDFYISDLTRRQPSVMGNESGTIDRNSMRNMSQSSQEFIPRQRPQRDRRPPNRYGEWVAPITATVDILPQQSDIYYV